MAGVTGCVVGHGPEHQAARLRVLLDGLRVQLVTTPRNTSASWALALLGDHLTALAERAT
jgi:hypothetical protein